MVFTADSPVPPRRTLTHRHDIDGLRGLAIALVVIFHVFVGRVSSGVDVFLLIGGVFFFGPQIRNALNPRGLTVVQAFLRLFRRLYPALVVVVGITLAAAVVIYAQVRWAHSAGDAVASLLYFQNLHLASQGQDYSAIGTDVSLYQHIWSMSAQMQVYLVSLVVIAVITGVFSWTRGKPSGGRVARILLIAATVVSFGYAMHLHSTDQALNYYSPLSRFWEIGLGGLFGLYLLNRPVPRWLRWPSGLLGLALIIGTGLFLDGAAQFPGPLTLIPLAGAALVILAGNPLPERKVKRARTEHGDQGAGAAQGVPGVEDPVGVVPADMVSVSTTGAGSVTHADEWNIPGVTALLSTRPFQTLGRISYSLYLWHWPLLVLGTYLFSTYTVTSAGGLQGITATLGVVRGIAVGVGVILISLVLAWLTMRFIEVPLQQKQKPIRSWVLGDRGYLFPTLSTGVGKMKAAWALVLVVVTGGVLGFSPYVNARNEARSQALTVADVDQAFYPGPAALLEGAPVPEVGTVLPDPIDDGPMMADTLKDICAALFDTTELVFRKQLNQSDEPCVYGDLDSERTMYLVGGSHSEHFLPALELIAKQRNFKIVPILKLGCVLGMGDLPKWDGSAYPECREWDAKAQKYIFDNPPTEGVFMTVTRPMTIQGDGPDQVPAEYYDIVKKLSDAGIHTWGMRDTPWVMDAPGVQGNARLCVADGHYSSADPSKDCGIPREEAISPVNPAIDAYQGLDITELDITDALCTQDRCPGVVGNVLVYRDAQHLTNLYAAMLAPEISRQMYDSGPSKGAGKASGSATSEARGSGGSATGAGGAKRQVAKDVSRIPKPLENGYISPDPTLLERRDAVPSPSPAPGGPATGGDSSDGGDSDGTEGADKTDGGEAGGAVDLDGDGYDDNTGALIGGGWVDPGYSDPNAGYYGY